MTLTDVFPTLRALPRADKLRLIQILAADVAQEEGIVLELEGKTFPIWSPHDAFQGAAALMRALEEDSATS